MRRALLIVPWIHDFSAYDFWACPLGLLSLGAVLRNAGWEVELFDLTDRHHPRLPKPPRERRFHTGKYYAQEIPKPAAIAWVPRRFKRYGLPPEVAEEELASRRRPDVILMTSRMTYWYTGVRETVALCRKVFPGVPIALGGTYATLCSEHAQCHSGADLVFVGEAEFAIRELAQQLSTKASARARLGAASACENLDTLPFPAWELMTSTSAAAVETSRGCPYRCTYCASGQLVPKWRAKSPQRVADELEFLVRELGAEDIAFYDDALLLNHETHFEKIAEELERRKVRARYHAPNSLFAHMITPAVAEALKRMGFETIRVSLETANRERLKQWNRRIGPHHFVTAMRNLLAVGFRREQIGVYILCAVPGQTLQEVRDTIDFVIEHGGEPRLAEFSPIPRTEEWQRAVSATELPIADEPLLQNNSIYWWASGAITPEALAELKQYARERLTQTAGSKT
ncbi:MAG: B12-binding domain-containing radical SAM protein [Candidatus Sumerlaea chitinivorans]|nr:B12-binding domain-containing radical SAM protein [Candidatus Sumerlaea chitinivorans]